MQTKSITQFGLDLGLYIENLFAVSDPQDNPQPDVADAVSVIPNDCLNEDHAFIVPTWAEQTFKVLMLKIEGMNLLLPASSVSYIEKVNRKITRLPLETSAFKGVIVSRGESIAVIDLYEFILEKPGEAKTKEVEDKHINYVLVMENGKYALACDEVNEVISMNKEEVSWHQDCMDNPCFIGIAERYLCPLTNIDYLNEQVAEMHFVQSLNKRKTGN